MSAAPTEAIFTLNTEVTALLAELEHLGGLEVSPQTLSDWLGQYSRVKCELQTLWIEHFLAIKRDTGDAEAQAVYKHLMAHWMPQIEAYDAPLARLALGAGVAETQPGVAAKLRADLVGQDTGTLRELLAQERLLSQQYDSIMTRQRIDLGGEKLPPHEALSRLRASASSAERETIWRATERADLDTARELDLLFGDLLRLRQHIAAEAGDKHYAEYAWRQVTRAYSIQEATDFLDDLAEVFADLMAHVDRNHAERLGAARLEPWDIAFKPDRPVNDILPVQAHVATAQEVLESIDPAFGAVVRKMAAEKRFDLEARPEKAGGQMASAAFLMASGSTEILYSSTGGINSFGTLLHELGHAVHCHFLASNPANTYWDYYNNHEVGEFCAFVFNIIGGFKIHDALALSPEDQRWDLSSLAQGFLSRLRQVDERVRMELWLYQQTGPVSTEDIDTHFLRLYNRPGVDWSGHEQALSKQWQTSFLFLHPLYNIEYAIATVAAMLWVKAYQDDPAAAVARLKGAMQVGATSGITAIFAEAGIVFPFSRAQLLTARDVLADWIG